MTFIMLVYAHEIGHQSINSSYGIDSEVKFGVLKSVTIAERSCPTEECKLAHNIHDSIMYHIEILIFLLIMGFMFLMMKQEQND
ncbi:hypothetical protein LCGC14_2437070 [marine sediment metagenome]|uniref:Uncharacterized protein n=1 Tax=marine sediment metagenome TaxID=412755 RepID=A0A0F9C7J6_9ZZZZ